MPRDDYSGDDRRENGGLTDAQVEQIRDAILASVHEEIGRSVVKKGLWVCGSIVAAAYAWLVFKGYITMQVPK